MSKLKKIYFSIFYFFIFFLFEFKIDVLCGVLQCYWEFLCKFRFLQAFQKKSAPKLVGRIDPSRCERVKRLYLPPLFRLYYKKTVCTNAHHSNHVSKFHFVFARLEFVCCMQLNQSGSSALVQATSQTVDEIRGWKPSHDTETGLTVV